MGGRRGKRPATTHGQSGHNPSSPKLVEARKRQKREEYKNAAEDDGTALPQKKWFRQRAHANPFSDHALIYPTSPTAMNWARHYPSFTSAGSERAETLDRQIEVADIGCGFGGLLFALAPRIPDTLILGLEIRVSVTEFVKNKIRAMRRQQQSMTNGSTRVSELHANTADEEQEEIGKGHVPESATQSPAAEPVPGAYQNISVLRANTMKFLPNFFPRASLRAIFLCFPDPHFKSRKHKARIVSSTLNSEYAFVLRPGEGKVYTITDVEDLHVWMCEKFDGHPAFERVSEEENGTDEMVHIMTTETEEGKKVERNGGTKFVAVWRRGVEPPWPGEDG